MIQAYQQQCQALVDQALKQLLSTDKPELTRLYEAMRYSVMNGGKRVRPLLVYAACEALGGELSTAHGAACAVELIHAYSLVHDDLPAMDNDELRRGLPTTHIAFDEAYAILAGDALQSLAFAAICNPELSPLESDLRLAMILELAQAAGAEGMVGGQAIDLSAVGQQLNQSALENMHQHKTGALIAASIRLGALASNQANQHNLAILDQYAKAIGLAFQVQDDILDVTSDTETLGKPQGSDLEQHKPTYPSLMGLETAKRYAQELHQQAISALEQLPEPERAQPLRLIADYIVQRAN